jgi:5-methylcytosine-specific restriction protein A
MADGIRQAPYREQAKQWYKSSAWQRLRKHQLDKHPYCQCPIHKGQNKAFVADVVDHHVPHRGSKTLFMDARNLRSFTKHCHDSVKQQLERTGSFTGVDEQGNPLDSRTAWWTHSE